MEENDGDYFKRKLRSLKKLIVGKRAILVIDNFSGEIKEDCLKVLDVGWKVLVLTREVWPSESYAYISLEAFEKRIEQYRLFEQYAGKRVGEEEKICLDRLIAKVDGHTLALELIARQIRKSRITIAEADALTEKFSFSCIAPEKVRFEKDNRTKMETVRSIISAVFFYHGENTEKRRILKALSLFGQSGVDIRSFREMMEMSSQDSVNELEEEGWLTSSETKLFMHPVIRETVAIWEWEDRYLADASHIMEYLYIRLKLEAEWTEYPLPYLKMNGYLCTVFENEARIKKWLEKLAQREGILGEVWKKRISQSDVQRVTDYKEVKELLQLAESVLENCDGVESLRQLNVRKELLGSVILSMPVEQEEYIIRHTEPLIDDPACKNGYMIMRLYHKLISVYLEQGAVEEAWNLLKKIRKFACRHNHFIKAEYYDILAEYYDSCLCGQYETDDEKKNRTKLFKAIGQSIFYMRMAKGGRKKILLIQYTLNKANVLIRSMPNKTKEIKKLLKHAKKWIEENTQNYSKLRWAYAMSAAWYYTLSEPNEERADQFLRYAEEIVNRTCATKLEYIDIIQIPYANIMSEFDNQEKAKEILLEGIRICGEYPEMLPYVRKKMDLYNYLLEICYYTGDRDSFRKVIRCIEEESERIRELGIPWKIPEELKCFADAKETIS